MTFYLIIVIFTKLINNPIMRILTNGFTTGCPVPSDVCNYMRRSVIRQFVNFVGIILTGLVGGDITGEGLHLPLKRFRLALVQIVNG